MGTLSILSRGVTCKIAGQSEKLKLHMHVRKVVIGNKRQIRAYKVVRSLLEHSNHLVGAINTCFGGIVIACSLNAMLPHHVHHLEMTRKNGLMVLEELQPKSAFCCRSCKPSIPTSGQGICLAGLGPLPVHRSGGPCFSPHLLLGSDAFGMVAIKI
jgi:hypothetical protein